ncbi:unnamed protein product [Linum tenue]|uniref:F-box domain-containing protein n=1 Tax=Linum tenue TaxID=586396 RepID=A0AAV0JXP3_9ROSI|nr:unnamed protein product [Linum tenue]
MSNSGRYTLGKSGRRRHKEEEDISAAADMLTSLPEPILSHILSFLDTKSAAQTSVLSRAWNSIWKYAPAVDLCRGSSQRASAFKEFVHEVLSSRSHVNVRKVTYVDKIARWSDETDKSVFMEVIQYALSHDVQQLVVDAGSDSTDFRDFYRFPGMFGSISNSNLKSLELNYLVFDTAFVSSGFKMLTSLCLADCALAGEKGEDLDPFSRFPCLTNLVLRAVEPVGGAVRVCGSQLLRLELDEMKSFEIEVFAPKLKFFRLRQRASPQELLSLTVPSLDHAEVALTGLSLSDIESNFTTWEEWMRQNFHFLFRGLHNTKSLKLDANVIEVLRRICVFLGRQLSPFRRLESLIVPTDSLPYELFHYLFKGSSCEEPYILLDL